MLIVVTGGSGSGKSLYAEEYVERLGARIRIYLATMKPYGEEGIRKIRRHQEMRKERGFETVECYTGIHNLNFQEDSVILLECMSNLTANEMYKLDGTKEHIADEIIQGIERIVHSVKHLVVVTNEVFSDGIDYGEETMQYIHTLGEINQRLARMADEVIEVVYSIPVFHKKRKEN